MSNKLSLTLTSLIAAIPAAVLAIMVVWKLARTHGFEGGMIFNILSVAVLAMSAAVAVSPAFIFLAKSATDEEEAETDSEEEGGFELVDEADDEVDQPEDETEEDFPQEEMVMPDDDDAALGESVDDDFDFDDFIDEEEDR